MKVDGEIDKKLYLRLFILFYREYLTVFPHIFDLLLLKKVSLSHM
jgi:hypothetical protein